MAEIVIAADECALTLNVLGYEFADAEDFHDANWLVIDAELAAKSSKRCRITVLTTELLGFRDRLRRTAESGSGFPTLDHLEEQVGCTITFDREEVEMSAFLREHGGPELSVSGRRMDRVQLDRALRALDDVIEAFPVRNRPA